MPEFHEGSVRPDTGAVATPILAVRMTDPTDLSQGFASEAAQGADGVWVALQVDGEGYLRIHDDKGIALSQDLATLTTSAKNQALLAARQTNELLRQVLIQLSMITQMEPDWQAIAAAAG